jgi:hypothetical protein
MKYIITENRLNNLIFKYLDVKLDGIEGKKGNYYDSSRQTLKIKQLANSK